MKDGEEGRRREKGGGRGRRKGEGGGGAGPSSSRLLGEHQPLPSQEACASLTPCHTEHSTSGHSWNLLSVCFETEIKVGSLPGRESMPGYS